MENIYSCLLQRESRIGSEKNVPEGQRSSVLSLEDWGVLMEGEGISPCLILYLLLLLCTGRW